MKPVRDWNFDDFRCNYSLALGFLRGMQSRYEDNKDIVESIERLIKVTRMEDFFLDAQEEELKIEGIL